MSVIESQAGMSDLIPCNELCGGDYAKYSFGQTESEVTVTVPVPPGTTSKQVTVQISSSSLSVGIKGEEPTISGKLFRAVKDSESTWCIQDRREVVVTLVKLNPKFEEWWPSVVDGERQIDMKTLKPPPVRIGDLDDGTRATVSKMMYEQQQKRLGKEPSGVPYPPS